MYLLVYLLMIADGLSISLESYGIYGESPLAVAPDESFCLGNQDSELFFFNKEGKLIKKSGGFGQGPGEFQELFQLVWQGEHLFAYDQSLQQWLVFNGAGEYLSVLTIPGTPHPRFSLLPLSLSAGLYFSHEERPSLVHWEGTEQVKRAGFPFWEDQPSTRIVMDNPVSIYYLWDSDLLLASNGNVAVTMQNISKRATLIDLKTGVSKVVKVPFKRRSVTEEDKQAFLKGFPKNYKAKMKSFETPDYWPGVKRILIDAQSQVWFFGQPQGSGVAYIRFNKMGNEVTKGTLKNLPAAISSRSFSFKEVDEGWKLIVEH